MSAHFPDWRMILRQTLHRHATMVGNHDIDNYIGRTSLKCRWRSDR